MKRPTSEFPQFQLGATADEAYNAAQVERLPIPDPGEIVNQMSQQFQIPRASPDADISRDMHGTD